MFLLVFVLSVFAQSQIIQISGKTIDFVSGTELAGASVRITNLNNSTSDTVTTDITGYWVFDLATTIEEPVRLPLKFEVYAPYPNPFNPSTKIIFSLPYNSPVKVTVFNILGEMVDSRESILNAGAYAINWE